MSYSLDLQLIANLITDETGSALSLSNPPLKSNIDLEANPGVQVYTLGPEGGGSDTVDVLCANGNNFIDRGYIFYAKHLEGGVAKIEVESQNVGGNNTQQFADIGGYCGVSGDTGLVLSNKSTNSVEVVVVNYKRS